MSTPLEPNDLFLLAGVIFGGALVVFALSAVGRFLFRPEGPFGSSTARERQIRREHAEQTRARREADARRDAPNATDDDLRDHWAPMNETR